MAHCLAERALPRLLRPERRAVRCRVYTACRVTSRRRAARETRERESERERVDSSVSDLIYTYFRRAARRFGSSVQRMDSVDDEWAVLLQKATNEEEDGEADPVILL